MRVATAISNRVAGVLLGLAAGDRNGGPLQMALCLAESLIERRGFDRDDIAARYVDWWKHGGFDTGPIAGSVFEAVAHGKGFDEASAQVHESCQGFTAGCNPTHRATPLAMAVSLRDDAICHEAIGEASLTHRHPLAGDVSAAAVAICRALIRGADWSRSLGIASSGRTDVTQAALLAKADDQLRRGGFAPDVLAAAVFFVDSSPDLPSALDGALKFAGPANYCPVLVGSIGGARWGARAVGESLLAHCQSLPRVEAAAEKLASQW